MKKQTVPFSESMVSLMARSGIVAVLTIDDPADAYPVARALLDGGVDIMELTLRTPVALAALHEIKLRAPEMTVGIGTVLTVEQVSRITSAGAAFGVAPGLNLQVLGKALEAGLSFAPGVCTPTEIEQALEAGCRVLKFFPAETFGGVKGLGSMAAPYAHLGIRFIPLGGLNGNNFADYLADPAVLAVGGSWIARREDIRAHDWAAITSRAAAAVATVRNMRRIEQ